MLQGKHIIVGVTGSIAAYKAAILVRLLVKEGAEVKIIMTSLAKEFITPLTLATLSKNPILVDFFSPENGEWNSHVDLGLWADAYLIAPATANTIGKMANGVADNLLLTTYLSAKCPVFVAPAMDLDMYNHPATQDNIATLCTYGNQIIEPSQGELASGLVGKGRMEEPEIIVDYLKSYFKQNARFAAKKVLITAGPTYEKIDPVRFIGNYSSGKMGYALAEAFAEQGAEVFLVSGPTSLTIRNKRIKLFKVELAEQMFLQSVSIFKECDIAVLSAAVADYTPATAASTKIKREEKGDMTLELKPTRDIAAELGKAKRPNQLLVGFALETNNELDNAKKKLLSKNLDCIVLNSMNDAGAGFNTDTNKVSIVNKEGDVCEFSLKLKNEVASDILDYVYQLLKN